LREYKGREGAEKNIDLFEKYLIINIDNIQRKYAIRSRYEINKNLTTGPDLQNIIKSNNDKGVTSHTLYSYQYFANKIHRVDHIFLLSYLFSFFLFFYRFPLIFSCKFAIALNSRLAQIAYVRFEEEIRKETQRDINDVSLCGFLFFFTFAREAEKTDGNFSYFDFFSAIRTSLDISSSFVILSSIL